jgi:hypothetical protein
MAAEKSQPLPSGSGFTRRGLYDFIVQHSQGGPYFFLVHLLPDIACDSIRRLQLLIQDGVDAARSQHRKTVESAYHRPGY